MIRMMKYLVFKLRKMYHKDKYEHCMYMKQKCIDENNIKQSYIWKAEANIHLAKQRDLSDKIWRLGP